MLGIWQLDFRTEFLEDDNSISNPVNASNEHYLDWSCDDGFLVLDIASNYF